MSRTLIGDPVLAARLRRETGAEVLFDAFSRGRYSSDASIYQVEPLGVVVPRTIEDVEITLAIARERGIPVLPRGAGTSQGGQTVAEALVIDTSKYLNQIIYLDPEARRVKVQPGLVLDHLNAALRPSGLHFPVDISPASRATIGGMSGNNSCGARSLRYGKMVDNVHAINALLADGTAVQFGWVPADISDGIAPREYRELVSRVRAIAAPEGEEIARRYPAVMRRVGGYNLDTVTPAGHNLAHLLVGSEGTLAFFSEIELALAPLPAHRVLAVCHFPTLRRALETTPAIVALDPTAVELVDRSLLDLAGRIPIFRSTLERFVRGRPQSLLLVEFSGEVQSDLLDSLRRLDTLMADHGMPDAVVTAIDAGAQGAIWGLRKAGLNIVMSMKGDAKPVSFIEDCAVRVEDLAAYTERLQAILARHGTSATWYAHASVGVLHVRPAINLKEAAGASTMRAIAEECLALVREYHGAHSGEHGDGLVRSEFNEMMFGSRIARAFESLKDTFDPDGRFNPGKIVRAPRMDDRNLFRYRPDYAPLPVTTRLDWSEWGGFSGAVEMCNGNGTCRKRDPGVMCPSFRATRDEQHVTRGRANVLRLALSGRLGRGALTSREMYDAMALCIGCKACRRECPTGVDMARMKIEFLYQYRKRRPLHLRERLIAWMPRYAPRAARFAPLARLRSRFPSLARASERLTGLSARRELPAWSSDPFVPPPAIPPERADLVLLVDTFNTWNEPDNARAALKVLRAAGHAVHVARAPDAKRPLCCGRTFLSQGLIDHAASEARRVLDALAPYVARGLPVIGLEPSCLFTLRDEYLAMLPGDATRRLAGCALLFEEYLARDDQRERLGARLAPLPARRALLHGHCHQKSFGAMDAVAKVLALVPELQVEIIDSGCCGMAGAFGYEAEHYGLSMRIGEAALLPAVRAAASEDLIVADGTSCRHQIRDGAGREALHVARVLANALKGG